MRHSRTQDHIPPLLRGIGFLLILLASLAVGVAEHRTYVEARAKVAHARAQMNAVAEASADSGQDISIAREIQLLRLQLQEEDFADRILENPWFQILSALGTALVAISFLYEARAKWPRRIDPERYPSS